MIRRTRRAWLFSVLSISGAAVGICPADADTADSLDHPLRVFYLALEASMRAGRTTPFRSRFDALAPVLDQVFDLETVLRVSVGLRWDNIDADLQTRLLKIYRQFTIATYVATFNTYNGERFRILPGQRDAGTDRIIATEIIRGNGDHLRLDYVMREANGNWRAVDVLLEGTISRVAIQRSDFRKLLSNGDVDALIASLHRKIADLSDGTLNS
jgi:phospholipid transport system substrate-binding protein